MLSFREDLTMATSLPAGLVPGTYVIDGAHSTASFTVRHAGIAKVRGTIAIAAGTITVGEDLDSTSVSAELDAASVNTGDPNRDAHLKSADFWSADEKPIWTFTSTSIKADGDDYIIAGDLAINGVTNAVELPTEFAGTATDPFGNDRAGFESEIEISRKDFGLTWNAALETGGVLVGDKVKIALDISAIKQA
jgi:polyisoprenoid-binding protein YceI